MKTVSIGDTHGIGVAYKVEAIIDQYDKFIFIGDYVDSFDIDNATIIVDLSDIIELKKKYPDKIILLWGNHDVQYLFKDEMHRCSGYRPMMRDTLSDIFNKNKDLFQLAYQIDDTLWTHAGVHLGWYRYRFQKFADLHHPGLTIADQLNLTFKEHYNPLFDVGYRRGGINDVGGPLWCDMAELKSSPLRNYNQIVGHTKTDHVQIMNIHNKEVVFIDVLQSDESLFYYKNLELSK